VTGDPATGEYYRACAAEMLAKAQLAPSKAIRQAYLNLALNWAQQAAERGDFPQSPANPSDKKI